MGDPAFLFYDGDAAKDVSHMNRLERGCYFDFIQAQRKFHGISVEKVRKILGKDFDTCWEALELILMKDENGLYYIEWLRESIKKRKQFSEIQRKRAQDYWDSVNKKEESPEMPRNNGGISTDIPLENENEIVIEIISFLNKVSGRKFRSNTDSTIKLINGRLSEGFTADDFKTVINNKVSKWKDDPKMSDFIRPETLFCKTHFESYLNEKSADNTRSWAEIRADEEKLKKEYKNLK